VLPSNRDVHVITLRYLVQTGRQTAEGSRYRGRVLPGMCALLTPGMLRHRKQQIGALSLPITARVF
jgi:hypothetical protein